ncbi:MAG: LamG domain-containing protein, partial [Lentisphaerae bacterium]|nr:LamG domain-containing protein [Lentisphaerota bacterium]
MNMRKVMFQCVAVLLASRWMVQAAETVLSFAGTSSYVDLAMPDVLQRPSNSPMTVEGWMYLRAVDTRDMLYSKNNVRSSNGYTHMFGFYENGRIAAFTGSAWREPSPAVTAALGRWMHVAFSFDGTTLTYYLDGEPIGTSAFNYNNVEANTVKLGGYISGTDIDGMKSEVRVWDHARSHAEIARDWRRRLVGHEPGLIGYWPLNEGEGMNVYDCTGNQSTGTLVNAAWTQADDLDLSPFALVNPATGSRRFTNTNVVDMLDLMFPWGA